MITLNVADEGLSTSIDYDGMTIDAAIGYLTTASDRLRKEREYSWDTCAECQRPWAEHGTHVPDDGDFDPEADDE